jgi:putative heme-binding domain-containing protein
VETKDGESYIGILANEAPTSITVRQAYGKQDVIKRSEITRLQSQGQSLMPEGIEAGMSQPDMADLLEFIESVDQK